MKPLHGPVTTPPMQQTLVVLLVCVSAAIGMMDAYFLVNVVQATMVAASVHWAGTAIIDFSVLILGLVWLSMVLYCHHVYLRGLRRGKLGRHWTRFTGVQMAILFVCEIMQWVLGVGPGGPAPIALAGGFGAASFALLFASACASGTGRRAGRDTPPSPV